MYKKGGNSKQPVRKYSGKITGNCKKKVNKRTDDYQLYRSIVRGKARMTERKGITVELGKQNEQSKKF